MAQETEAGRVWEAADLLGGEDHDFVVTLYLAAFGRPPDPAGYRHYRDSIAGRPERRIEALREAAELPEARQAGNRISFGAATAIPPSPGRSTAVMLGVLTAWITRQAARQEEAIGLLGAASLGEEVVEARDAALRFEINALRREVTDRLDGLLGPVGGPAAEARDAAVASLARLVARHVGDRVAAAEAQHEARFQALEARLLALEATRGA